MDYYNKSTSTLGDRTFAMATPKFWNVLQSSRTLYQLTFIKKKLLNNFSKQSLKTHFKKILIYRLSMSLNFFIYTLSFIYLFIYL